MMWWWQSRNLISICLLPLALLYWLITVVRRVAYKIGIFTSYRAPVPVIVVGNISIGGTGKTPFTIALIHYLIKQGYKPGIVSRGYSGKAVNYPMKVTEQSNVQETGDEALMLKLQCACPVYIDPKRPRAIQAMLNHEDVDIVISDDGLQHYAMQRDVEIVMVDGELKFGNRFCLPAGPLRETVSRLKKVDFVITTGSDKSDISPWTLNLEADKLINCRDSNKQVKVTDFKPKTVHAIAGIGNPQRFCDTLKALEFQVDFHPFPDHYIYKMQDLEKFTEFPLVMTAKDAVKLRKIAKGNWWYLAVQPQCSNGLLESIQQKITMRRSNSE